MFYRAASNQYINEGQQFEIDGTVYPQNWLNLSTPEEKAALGLQEVTDANSPEDDRFYWVSSALNGAVRTYTNTPKDLAGLKATWTQQIDQAAYSLLLPTDWMSIKALETQVPMPADWSTWRNSIRTTASTARAAIASAADIPALQTAIQVAWPHDPNYTGN